MFSLEIFLSDIQSNTLKQAKKPALNAFWNIGILLLCLWACSLFISMNYQYQKGLYLISYTKEIFTLGLAIFLITAPWSRRPPRFIVYAFLGTLAVGWFWGLTDTFYWDGVHIAGRSLLLMNGEISQLPRFSLNYVFLGAILHYIGNANSLGHLYVMMSGAGLLYLLSRTARYPGSRFLVVMMAFISPHLFILNKWLYTDIPTMAAIFATILAYVWAERHPTIKRYALPLFLLIIASLLKEIGCVAVLPFLFIPLLVPKGQRLRSVVFSLISLAVALGIFIALYKYYRPERTEAANEHVGWLLLNKDAGVHLWLTVHWFFWAVREHLKIAAWWGFFLFAFLRLFQPKKSWGYIFLSLAIVCQIVLMVEARYFADWKMWQYCPLNESGGSDLAYTMMILFLILLLAGWAMGGLRCHRPKKIECAAWIMVIGIIFIFSASGKITPKETSGYSWIDIDWRYLANAVPFMILLSAQGAAHLLTGKKPLWFRILAGTALALTFYVIILRSSALASYFGEKARLNGRFYEIARKQPERVIFTHWPFVMVSPKQYDYGTLRWKSDKFEIRDFDELRRLLLIPPGQRPKINGLVLQTEGFDADINSRNLFPDWVKDESVQIGFIRPFDFKINKIDICHNYLVRVKFPGARPRPPAIDPVIQGTFLPHKVPDLSGHGR